MSETAGKSQPQRLSALLKQLIAAFQDEQRRPRDLSYSNLTDLSDPTQMKVVTIPQGRTNYAAILVTHLQEQENGAVQTRKLGTLTELADFSEVADDCFSTGGLSYPTHTFGRFRFPEVRPMESVLLSLSGHLRTYAQSPGPARGGFLIESQISVQTEPPGALWLVRYRSPLPTPDILLTQLGQPQRRIRGRAKARGAAPSAPQPTGPVAYAAYTEPLVWFGDPPFPSVRDKIMGATRYIRSDGRVLERSEVLGVDVRLFNSGLILAVEPNRSTALAAINQVVAAISRSGLQSASVPDFDLIEVNRLEPDSGQILGSTAAMTHRNFLLHPISEWSMESAYLLPESAAAHLLRDAAHCARDADLARESLRLLHAMTLLYRGHNTEAFIMAWTLIETQIGRHFLEYWRGRGRSKTAIGQMQDDWKVSQQIDFLAAVGKLAESFAGGLHRLRKRRNAIVHDLADSTTQEAEECIKTALGFTPLGAFAHELKPERFLIR